MLPSSDLHDSVLCSEIANLIFTGQNQIILGTYGKVMMSSNNEFIVNEVMKPEHDIVKKHGVLQ